MRAHAARLYLDGKHVVGWNPEPRHALLQDDLHHLAGGEVGHQRRRLPIAHRTTPFRRRCRDSERERERAWCTRSGIGMAASHHTAVLALWQA